ncbi:MAG: hypothetical protein AB1479_09840 [Pseudomonadota bacterium]
MSIIQKIHVQQEQRELERYWSQLQTVLAGQQASGNLAEHYRYAPDVFERDFTDVDLVKLKTEIKHFMTALQGVEAALKSKVVKR